ncbi:hypothetical protein SAMN02745166_02296 [Prosthecobacter debontii]|uniref:Uncharacterized protein n=1 Tax=Prosthecobacter debontii TaxID=48467 RepID=A0A1T4Y056_9BACT|nr:hypothetical protein SAMN02745166_02296 [Prosthecobacter debontii]
MANLFVLSRPSYIKPTVPMEMPEPWPEHADLVWLSGRSEWT